METISLQDSDKNMESDNRDSGTNSEEPPCITTKATLESVLSERTDRTINEDTTAISTETATKTLP